MANENLGLLALNGKPITRFGTLQRPGLGIRTDTYAFTTGPTTANVSVSVSSASSERIALVMFQDNNADGIINKGDQVVANAGNGGTFQSVNPLLTRGSYIARLTSALDTGYSARFARSDSGSANPLAGKEIPLGTISQDLRKVGSVNNSDTADNFAFTLDGNSSLNIDVLELGNKRGDVNIRVVQDRNSNGTVEADEIVVKGTSSNNGTLDSIAGLKGAGDYILQVCQSNGSTRFGVTFDHSAA